ncbi:MAG TPA: hypothetical protein VEJ86_05420 [Candidatus Binataceae bacterium]|nr:hypothetical protein [Candidatus Binataceae bacterium]
MSVYTHKFASEDDYEAWLAHAGPRITVLSIKKNLGPHRIGAKREARPVELRYQTSDRHLKPSSIKGGHAIGAHWRLAPVFTFGALVALLTAYAMN